MGVKILESEEQTHFYSEQDIYPGFLFLSRGLSFRKDSSWIF